MPEKKEQNRRVPNSAYMWPLSRLGLLHPWGCFRGQRLADHLLVPLPLAMTPSNKVALAAESPRPGGDDEREFKVEKDTAWLPRELGPACGHEGSVKKNAKRKLPILL